MKAFRFSGNIYYRRSFAQYYEGWFVQRPNNEIVGISRSKEGAFIKGLFINNKQLVFVERVVKSGQIHEFVFNDIRQLGTYDAYIRLAAILGDEERKLDVNIQIHEEYLQEEIIKVIENDFEEFYEKLSKCEKYYFDELPELRLKDLDI